MKSIKRKQLFLDLPIIFLLIAAAAFVPTPAKAIPTDSLDYILYFLRSRGHSLFANAISTSDLLFDVLSLPSLTLLPPSDPALFVLDMTESPAFYLAVLRLHVVPFRLDLRYLQNNASLHTLVPSRRLHATRVDPPAAAASASSLRLDGVEVLFPALFYSSNVAVYGLQGMLPSRVASPPPAFQWFRPSPAVPRHRNRNRNPNWNRNATVIPPLVPATRPVPFTPPISPRRVPRSSGGTNSPLRDHSTVVLSPPPPPVNLTDSPDSAPGNSALDFHPSERNPTVHHPTAPMNQTSVSSADHGAPALAPLSSPANTAVSSIHGGGLAFPPIEGSSPTAQMSLPPAIGDNFLPPEQEVDDDTALGDPPILPPSSVDGGSIVLDPSPTAQMSLPPAIGNNFLPPEQEVDNQDAALGVSPNLPPSSDGGPMALTETLPPAFCPPLNLTEVSVMVPASQSRDESAARTPPSPSVEDGGWTGRNVGEATASGTDYPGAKRDDDEWEVSAGELTEIAPGGQWDHVSIRDDYAMLGPNGVDHGTD